jgi:hypothetical protein
MQDRDTQRAAGRQDPRELGDAPVVAAVRASAGVASSATTRCPRAISARETRPSPQPTSMVSRPGAGAISKKLGWLMKS